MSSCGCMVLFLLGVSCSFGLCQVVCFLSITGKDIA